MKKNYYLILRLQPQATADEIRSAYRRRALELHPDLSGAGSSPFLELQEAYAVLSDPTKRAVYDREADEIPIRRVGASRRAEPAVPQRFRAEPIVVDEPQKGVEEISPFRSFQTFAPSFEELFDRLWSNFDLRTRPKAERLESLTVDVPLSARQALAGGEVRLLVPARGVCPVCRGYGRVGIYECRQCEGQGALTGEYPLRVAYPAGLLHDYTVRLPLDRLGIQNFYLTIRFRPTESF